jgi:hypothetical protein
VWRLRWDNVHKEVLWRLAVLGCPGGQAPGCQCCQGPPALRGAAKRMHQFWDCPVSCAVRAQLSGVLAVPPVCADVWLVRAPPGVLPVVWCVVALAALSAMEHGRACLWSRCASVRLPPGPCVERTDLVRRVCDLAAARFWFLLSDFAQDCAREGGWLHVPADHPFLCVRDGVVCVARPAMAPFASG